MIVDIKDFYLKEQVYDLDDLIKNPNAYIGGFNTESLVTLMKANRKKYIESGILLIEGGIAFTSSYKEIGQLPIFDDLPSLYGYYLNAMEEYLEEGIAAFYYPSQPIGVKLEKYEAVKQD